MANILLKVLDETLSYLSPPMCLHCLVRYCVPNGFLCDLCEQEMLDARIAPALSLDYQTSLYRLTPTTKSLIHGLKYRGMTRVAEYMVSKALHGANVDERLRWVPVPLHGPRKRERGYNQAEKIAKSLCERFGGQLDLNCLVRSGAAISQTKLGRDERQWNIVDSFKVRRTPFEKNIVVDDVLTTGATTNACRKALEKAGAKSVTIYTLAYEAGSKKAQSDFDLDQSLQEYK